MPMVFAELLWRSLILGAAVYGATVVLGLIGLPWLRRMQLRQTVRDDGPKSHYAKSGTPTFGGAFFILPILLFGLITVFFWHDLRIGGVILLFMLLFALVGLADDYVKVRINREGLTVKQKTILLGSFSLLAAAYFVFLMPGGAFILVPFTLRPLVLSVVGKIVYFVFLVPFLFYMSNSVNITDGLDGLLAGLMAISSIYLAVTAAVLFQRGQCGMFSFALPLMLLAGCLGFLIFNHHPAKVFMGDLGSQALGIGFTLLTVVMGVPYLAILTGFVFFFEGISVTLQFLYFRRTKGKRLFRMAPIHHHFELGGWAETKVVRVFYVVAVMAGLVGLVFAGGWL